MKFGFATPNCKFDPDLYIGQNLIENFLKLHRFSVIPISQETSDIKIFPFITVISHIFGLWRSRLSVGNSFIQQFSYQSCTTLVYKRQKSN